VNDTLYCAILCGSAIVVAACGLANAIHERKSAGPPEAKDELLAEMRVARDAHIKIGNRLFQVDPYTARRQWAFADALTERIEAHLREKAKGGG
jgi:hypothetical protein